MTTNKSVFFTFNPFENNDKQINVLNPFFSEGVTEIFLDNTNSRSINLFFVNKTKNNNSVMIYNFDQHHKEFKNIGSKVFSLDEGDEIKLIKGKFSKKKSTNFGFVFTTKLNQVRNVILHLTVI